MNSESSSTINTMAYQPSTDKSAVVSNEHEWIPIDRNTPRGLKMLLWNDKAGVALLSTYTGDPFFTHYFPLPRRRKDGT